MFQSFARSICVVAALATGGVATATAPAAADGLRFGVTIGSGHAAQPVRHVRRGHHARVACSPRRAVRKARNMGVHRAHVRRANRRAVVVAGHSRGHRAVVRFARERGCPVISFRRR
ncbi:hypothetical protein [Aurantimonas coralicida]|uniref:hypothetical protein n=1 Tax=Aurantimonas coralicida TaxID=182270 RepID=UPI00165D92B8|nr:hypothetical protein [Aurantimonas coralicida]MCD1642039.1 hypothetical protein [Aurantimonas coralicida]